MTLSTRYALIHMMCTADTSDALDNLACMHGEIDTLDLDTDAMSHTVDLDLDLDTLDEMAVDPVALYECAAFECLSEVDLESL